MSPFREFWYYAGLGLFALVLVMLPIAMLGFLTLTGALPSFLMMIPMMALLLIVFRKIPSSANLSQESMDADIQKHGRAIVLLSHYYRWLALFSPFFLLHIWSALEAGRILEDGLFHLVLVLGGALIAT